MERAPNRIKISENSVFQIRSSPAAHVDSPSCATAPIHVRRHVLVIVILGVLAIFRVPMDIFPEIDIPVVSLIWSYVGISPEENGRGCHHPLRALLYHFL
jgi:hypothetical protein